MASSGGIFHSIAKAFIYEDVEVMINGCSEQYVIINNNIQKDEKHFNIIINSEFLIAL